MSLNSASKDVTEYTLVKSAHGRVKEWKYFMQYHSSHHRKEFVVCSLCHEKELDEAMVKRRKLDNEKYEVKWLGSTSKLGRHLMVYHKDVHDEMEKAKLTSSNGIKSYLKNLDNSKEKFLENLEVDA